MTEAQRLTLSLIAELTVNDVPPTLDELRIALGLASKGNVHRRLVALRKLGLIRWAPGHARSLWIVADSPAYTPAALCELSSEALRTLIATASGILAHKEGGGAASAALKRIGDRLTGRPRVSA